MKARSRPVATPRPLVPGGLLSVGEVMTLLAVSRDTVERMLRAGTLGPVVKIGRSVRVHRAAVTAFIEQGGSQ